MKHDVIDLANKKKGTIDLDEDIFGVEIRKDIIARTIRWQLNNRQSGNHNTKERSDVSGTKAKPFRQKGTGRARQGTMRAPQMRGGGVVFGPQVRSHGTKLQKKVRRLALKTALSVKHAEGNLIVLEDAKSKTPKTVELTKSLKRLKWGRALVIDGPELDANFAMAARNIVGLDVLSSSGANVYDILRRDKLVLTRDAVALLTERLK
ncbi:MAG: 50S ribosomal protein L4 [Magnetovibrio sp.]|nr:50S ribosomal protein L4 [Magnetovibrio sp.]|tara:strand:- start:1026 stop:1646 length:621 start_codon:yes stop_codon:yes gene_type:complete